MALLAKRGRCFPSVEERGGKLPGTVHNDQVGGLAGFKRAGLIAEPCHGGWVGGEKPQALLQLASGEGHEIRQGLVQREHASREDVAEGGPSVCHLNGEAAQLICAIGHAGGAHCVSNQNGALRPLAAPPDLHHLRRVVDTVADQLGEE